MLWNHSTYSPEKTNMSPEKIVGLEDKACLSLLKWPPFSGVILQSQSQPAMTSIPSEPEPRHVPLVRTIPRAASAWQWISGWIIACKVVIVPWIGGDEFPVGWMGLETWDLLLASWPAKSSLSFKEDVLCKDRFEKLGSYFPTATDCFMTTSCSWRLETLFTL